MSHQANIVLQLRCLDTGVAVDVSGIMRISQGGGAELSAFMSKDRLVADYDVEGKEFLYFVRSDGGVRVFGRGE
jgi:elongator complex protein 6